MTESNSAGLFFFFGSLRRGYWNNGLISNQSKLLGHASTKDPFRLYIGKLGTVPTCVPALEDKDQPPAGPLHGEIWELSPADARSVYLLETGYDNAKFDVSLNEAPDEVLSATIFHHTRAADCGYMRGGPELVPSGDYTDVVNVDGARITKAA